MSRSARVVAAARGAVGVRYRLHGRDPAFGLDCVGLVALALRAGGYDGPVPDAYGMRSGAGAAAMAAIERLDLVRAVAGPGALGLFEVGAATLHLAIWVPGGLVHADAIARRVVERPGLPPWRAIASWRLKGEE